MSRIQPKHGAVALLASAGLVMVGSIATGHSVRAEIPPDLSPRPADLVLDVWKAATLLVEEPRTAIVDVRPADAYARYHLPGAVSMPGATADELRYVLRRAPAALVYAGKDEIARKLVEEVRVADPAGRAHVLAEGARAWYLAFQLPVPLFSDAAPPPGYTEAHGVVQRWFEQHGAVARGQAISALETLAKASYGPNLLQSGKKAAAPGSGKKKLAGGCG